MTRTNTMKPALALFLALTAASSWARVGTATVYHPRFHGRKTASRSTYNHHGLSVASRAYPLGARVRIKNLSNGKTATAIITDLTGRTSALVDLSGGLAKRLGIKGRAKVDVRRIRE